MASLKVQKMNGIESEEIITNTTSRKKVLSLRISIVTLSATFKLMCALTIVNGRGNQSPRRKIPPSPAEILTTGRS